jgi:NTP pyrophosphatase (non-canonical NTP hydrolase)
VVKIVKDFSQHFTGTNQRIDNVTEKSASDANTTTSQLRDEVQQFIQERDWGRYHTPKNLGMSIAIEAAEIMEHFQWSSSDKSIDLVKEPETKKLVADELADVIIYCLALADQAEIDISRAVRSKMERNRSRFPIGYMPTIEE